MFGEHVTCALVTACSCARISSYVTSLYCVAALHPIGDIGGAPHVAIRRSPAPIVAPNIKAGQVGGPDAIRLRNQTQLPLKSTQWYELAVQPWGAGHQYNIGDEVEYNGVLYNIIQPHFSQGDWTPDVTPALWGRQYGSAPTQPQAQQDYSSQDQRPWDKHDQTTVEFGHEEKQKNWYDIDPERRKQLEIGGGLLAGAALLGGGFLAYKKHKENEEEKKAQAWALQNWMTDAQNRARDHHQNGARGPVTWLLTSGKNIPQGAFQAGQEKDGTPLYVARTYFEDGVHPGKVNQYGGLIGYDGDEISVEHYEVLVADPRAVRWVQTSHPLNIQSLGARPVEGGREADGTPLYIVQAPYKDGVHPGKTSEKLRGADITYGGKEKIVNPYNLLVYA